MSKGLFSKSKYHRYSVISEEYVKSDIAVILMLAVILLPLFFRKIRMHERVLDADERILVAGLTFALLALPFPLLGLRVVLMIYIFSGYYLIKSSWGLSPIILLCIYISIIALQIYRMYLGGDTGSFALWAEFPSWSFMPGYFFIK
jgi:hypothetical protein